MPTTGIRYVMQTMKDIMPTGAGPSAATMLSPQKAGRASVKECVRKPTIVSIQKSMILFFFSIMISVLIRAAKVLRPQRSHNH